MMRAPCCEKMGLKKGPWTPEEDRILISYIQKYGHNNWRALPKEAGLLRCGKSCRLRWINYLRPDIKRGNFSKEEEETIIKLHEMLGNRWSAIAAKLPGRTDNEIKNVWHTHLKKRVKQNHAQTKQQQQCVKIQNCGIKDDSTKQSESANLNIPTHLGRDNGGFGPTSPQPSCSDRSLATDTSVITTSSETNSDIGKMIKDENLGDSQCLPMIDENFCSEPESVENYNVSSSDYLVDFQPQFPFVTADTMEPRSYGYFQTMYDDDMDFWYNLFVKSGGIEEFLRQKKKGGIEELS